VLVFVAFWRYLLAALTGLAAAIVSPSPSYMTSQRAMKEACESYGVIWGLVDEWKWDQLWHDWKWVVILAGFGILATIEENWPVATSGFGFLLLAGSIILVAVASVFAFAFVKAAYPYSVNPDLSTVRITVSQVLKRPWVPAEEISVRSGRKYVGYTLSTKDAWQVVLKDQDRRIVIIHHDDVVSRRVCALSSDPPAGTPLIPLWALNTTPRARPVIHQSRGPHNRA
jgi:hypothetical protein